MGWTVYNSDGKILQSAELGDNAVTSAKIADDAVTYAKMQNLATADRVLGSTSTGVIGEVQIVPDMLATNAVTNVKVATGIDAVKLADGSVTNAELQYINSLSSNAQTQIGLKAPIAGPTFTGTATFATLSDGTIAITAWVDEDNMSSNSATLVPTQQSVKAYVDANSSAAYSA